MEQPILVAVDFSVPSQAARDEAIRLAKERGTSIALAHAIAALPRLPAYSMSLGATYNDYAEAHAQAQADETKELIKKWVRPIEEAGVHVTVHVSEDSPEDLVARTAKEVDAQLIIIGSHGWRGFRRFVLGSVAQAILHQATVPVLVLPSGPST